MCAVIKNTRDPTHILLKVQTRPLRIHPRCQKRREHVSAVVYQLLRVLRQRDGVQTDNGEKKGCAGRSGFLEL